MKSQLPSSPDIGCSKISRKRLQAGSNQRYKELLKSEPYTPDYIYRQNPYSGEFVNSRKDYEEYLHQRAYLETLEFLLKESHDSAVQIEAWAKAKDLTEEYELHVMQAENKLKTSNKALADANSEKAKLSSQNKSLMRSNNVLRGLFTIALAVIALFLFVLLPRARTASYDLGAQRGNAAGYSSGLDEGRAQGYEEGREAGHSSGYSEGVDVGYHDGYADGFNDGLAEASPGDAPSNSIPEEAPVPSVPIPYGHAADEIVYVSKRSGTIHSDSDCSGMKYYDRMTLEDALEAGFTHYCEHCF